MSEEEEGFGVRERERGRPLGRERGVSGGCGRCGRLTALGTEDVCGPPRERLEGGRLHKGGLGKRGGVVGEKKIKRKKPHLEKKKGGGTGPEGRRTHLVKTPGQTSSPPQAAGQGTLDEVGG